MKGLAWWLVAQGVLVVLAVGAPIAYAQTPPAGAAYPNRPITLLHAYSAGGSSAVILRALAENGDLPRWFGKVHPEYRTPSNAVLFGAAVALVLAFVDGGSRQS